MSESGNRGGRHPEAAGVYDLRSTAISDRLDDDGVSVFRLADVMGTSVRMIERHYGRRLDGDAAEIARLLNAGDAERERQDQVRSENG